MSPKFALFGQLNFEQKDRSWATRTYLAISERPIEWRGKHVIRIMWPMKSTPSVSDLIECELPIVLGWWTSTTASDCHTSQITCFQNNVWFVLCFKLAALKFRIWTNSSEYLIWSFSINYIMERSFTCNRFGSLLAYIHWVYLTSHLIPYGNVSSYLEQLGAKLER